MNLSTVGIICEYNPFHYGHRYHISQARKITGADNVICLMSGSMVQRGEPAIFDKWIRAKSAIDGGADLVIELPAYYALQSAENFAYGGVAILNGLGITDALCFGAETDDINLLDKAATLLADPTPQYTTALSEKLSSGSGYPAACEYALRQCMEGVDDSFFSPNNTLAMCYMSAIKSLESSIVPFCVKRSNDYHSHMTDDDFKSATAVRQLINSGNDYSVFAPDYSSSATHSIDNATSYILGFFRSVSPDSLSDIKGYEDGIANLVVKSAKKACTLSELYEMCTGKRYTLSRIRRFCACAVLGIRGDFVPDYVRPLAMNSKGMALLKQIKQKSAFSVVTKAADFCGSEMFDMDVSATDFASLCCDAVGERYCGKDFLNSPVVLK